MISRAIERDRGRSEFERSELYLPNEICRAPTERQEVFSSWSDAVVYFRVLINQGVNVTEARRDVLEGIRRSQIGKRKSSEAIRKSFERAERNPERLCVATGDPIDRRKKTPFNPGNPGRKPLAEFTEEEQRAVQRLVVQTDPNTGTRISRSMAIRLYAHSDKCREELAAVILKPRASKHSITPTLKRQARITAETKMLYRGNKNFALNGYSQPRSLTFLDSAGVEQPILPGDVDERDDMTLNQPWYVEWEPDGTDPCAEKFGVKLLRGQLLVNLDVGSQRGLSFELLARPHDAYRADDIWAWIGRDYREIGLPRFGERMERGIWEAKAIQTQALLLILDEAQICLRSPNR